MGSKRLKQFVTNLQQPVADFGWSDSISVSKHDGSDSLPGQNPDISIRSGVTTPVPPLRFIV